MARVRFMALLAVAVGVLTIVGSARADVGNIYSITVETTLTPPNCKWVGKGQVTLGANSFGGAGSLQLDLADNPDPFCVANLQTLSGLVQGTITGNAIAGVSSFGPFVFTFTGTTPDGGFSGSGTWQGTVGPLNAHGIWSAQRVVTPAPALGQAGLAALVVMLFGVAAWVLRRPRRLAAP